MCLLNMGSDEDALLEAKKAIQIDATNAKFFRIVAFIYMKAAKAEHHLQLAKIGLENFTAANELNADPVNQKNYFNARKFVFFLTEEQKYKAKNELLHYVEKFYPREQKDQQQNIEDSFKTLESIEPFFLKTFYEENKEVPKEFQCAISLVF